MRRLALLAMMAGPVLAIPPAIVGTAPATVRYTLRDQFLADDPAPLVSPRAAEPGPGTWTVTDTGSKASIGAHVLTVAGGTTTWTDPLIRSQAITRASGLAFVASMKKSSVAAGNDVIVGWSKAAACGTANLVADAYFATSTIKSALGSAAFSPVPVVAADTWYRVALVLRATGYHLLRWESGRTWTRLWVGATDSTATLYASLQQNTAPTVSYADAQVRPVTGWDSDAAVALVSSTTAGTFAHTADCLIDWTPGGVSRSVTFRKVDASNFMHVEIDGAGALTLKQTKTGTTTTLSTWAGPMDGTERVVIEVVGQRVYAHVADAVRVSSASANQFLTATAGELSSDATTFYVWRRTETLPFDTAAAGPTPDTAVLLQRSGVTIDGSGQITAWTNDAPGGPATTLRSASAFMQAAEGVPWLGTNPGIQVPLAIGQPWTLYALVNRNNRPGSTALSSDRMVIRRDTTSVITFPPATGVLTVQGAEVASPSLAENIWQRARVTVNDLATQVQIEGTVSSFVDATSAALSGTITLLSQGLTSGAGIHGWVPYLRLVHGDPDATYHAAIWAEMGAIQAELAKWGSTVVTADDKHNGFPGLAILASGKEVMVYRKGSTHAAPLWDGIVVMRSRANSSAAWSAESTVLDQYTGDGLDSRDPSIMVTSTGRLVVTGFTGSALQNGQDAFRVYSDDDGATWSAKGTLGHPWPFVACSSPAVQIGANLYQALYNTDTPADIGLAVSEDDGATWDAADFLPVANGTAGAGLYEPTMIVVGSEWCVMARGQDHNSRLWTSTDSGATWTPRGVVFQSQSRHMLVTQADGSVISIHRKASASSLASLVYRTSTDGLRTWSAESSIKPHHTGTEYAAAVLRADGKVAVVAAFNAGATGADIHTFTWPSQGY